MDAAPRSGSNSVAASSGTERCFHFSMTITSVFLMFVGPGRKGELQLVSMVGPENVVVAEGLLRSKPYVL